MTDPLLADATYIEPIHWENVEKIIEKEKPDAILPTMGGQTALNTALSLAKEGVLKKHGVILIGASREAIDKAEDRQLFDQTMQSIGIETPKSGIAHNLEDALNVQKEEIGTACSLSLRPERVMLNPEPGECVNNFGAKIVELIYLGDHIRCRMNVCANDEFIVKVPNTQPNLTLAEGDDVKVGWHIEDCRALDA